MRTDDVKIRVSGGVGSSPKWWLVLRAGSYARQIGEVDKPTETAPLPTAILWGSYREVGGRMSWPSPFGPLGVTERRTYASLDEVINEAVRLWPGARIVDERDEEQDWL